MLKKGSYSLFVCAFKMRFAHLTFCPGFNGRMVQEVSHTHSRKFAGQWRAVHFSTDAPGTAVNVQSIATGVNAAVSALFVVSEPVATKCPLAPDQAVVSLYLLGGGAKKLADALAGHKALAIVA
jgi:hypothetical protein